MIPVSHNELHHRFEGSKEGKSFFVEYEISSKGDIRITHTYVHPDLRGQGIAAQLLETLSQWAKKENHRITPLCSYAIRFYQHHKEYLPLVNDQTPLLEEANACHLPQKKN
ncbi:MAG: N-acetyltransferase [Brevinematales bacterium]|nr:N-acetyltransferase [Brevinematales bacterium]